MRGDHLEDEAGAGGDASYGSSRRPQRHGACVCARLLFTQITAQAPVWTRFVIPIAAMSATFLAQKMSFSHCTSPEILWIVRSPLRSMFNSQHRYRKLVPLQTRKRLRKACPLWLINERWGRHPCSLGLLGQ